MKKKNIFTKIVDVISELHKINIAHRDIKPENFLIQIKNNDIFIKITDLDFACINDTDFNFTGGTLQYASYELLNFKLFMQDQDNYGWKLYFKINKFLKKLNIK